MGEQFRGSWQGKGHFCHCGAWAEHAPPIHGVQCSLSQVLLACSWQQEEYCCPIEARKIWQMFLASSPSCATSVATVERHIRWVAPSILEKLTASQLVPRKLNRCQGKVYSRCRVQAIHEKLWPCKKSQMHVGSPKQRMWQAWWLSRMHKRRS